jgi:outer membrane protein, heavy metal efflux system
MAPKFLIVPLLLMALAAGPVSGEQAGVPDLELLIEEALAVNPEIQVSEERWQAFVQRARGAGTLEDPMLMFGVQNGIIRDPTNFSRDPMTSKVIGISQMLPFPGKRGLERQAATLGAESYRWLYEERRLELARMVRETWYQLYYLDRALELVDRNIAAVDEIISITETMYGVGQGQQQDVFKAHLERSRMLNMRIMLNQQRVRRLVAFNALLFRPAATPVTIPTAVQLTPLPATAAELERMAESHRPLLKSLGAQVARGKAEQRLAQREYYPDFTVSVEYMQREPIMGEMGEDMYSLGLSFNLPLQRERRRAMVAEAGAETRMAAAEINEVRNAIRAGVADLIAQLDENRQRVQLYEEVIIPQANMTLEAATAAYQVGRVDFMTLLDSQMAIFGYEQEFYEAMAEYHMAMAQLEALVGGF